MEHVSTAGSHSHVDRFGAALPRVSVRQADVCFAVGKRLVEENQLAASVFTPANTGLALSHLHRFWTQGTPVPLRSFTEARPWPPGSAGS